MEIPGRSREWQRSRAMQKHIACFYIRGKQVKPRKGNDKSRQDDESAKKKFRVFINMSVFDI